MLKNPSFRAVLIGLAIVLCLPRAAPAAEAEYRILPGDVLAVAVWKEEDLSLEVLVRPDGRFSFPLVGDVQAAGRSVNEIRDEIAGRIDTYIPDAVVTVLVREIAGNKAYVVGKVNRPGPFVMNDDTDVMQALSIAGGTTTFAALKKIVILRRAGGAQTAIPFNYNEVEDGERLEQNIVLQPGDIVVVP